MHRLHEAGFDRGDQRRMRIKRPVARDLSLEPERGGIGRQQQLDGGGVEADAMVERFYLVLGIDALDGHHRHQDLHFGNLRRIAREQRLDVVRRWRGHDEVDPVGRNVDPRHHVDDTVDLRDHDAAAEGGGFDDDGRVFGIGAGVEIAVAVRRFGLRPRPARRAAAGR
jgi:hypothetical protein